jgi:hypothetical protein
MCKSQINTAMWKHKFSLDIIKLDIIFGDSKYDSLATMHESKMKKHNVNHANWMQNKLA